MGRFIPEKRPDELLSPYQTLAIANSKPQKISQFIDVWPWPLKQIPWPEITAPSVIVLKLESFRKRVSSEKK